MDEFELAHRERVQERYWKTKSLDYMVDMEYSLFKFYCRAFNKPTNEESFKQYLIAENKVLDFKVKKRILEKYYNYTFIYDSLNDKLIIKRPNLSMIIRRVSVIDNGTSRY